MKKIMNKQAGFTLIELVVVIVILGILAATAAPKFIDLTSDARGSVMEAVRGSINSATDLAHSKALVDSQTGPTGAISVAGGTINLVNGWPAEASINALLELDGDVAEVSGTAGTFEHTNATDKATCVVVFNDSTGADIRPIISIDTDGC